MCRLLCSRRRSIAAQPRLRCGSWRMLFPARRSIYCRRWGITHPTSSRAWSEHYCGVLSIRSLRIDRGADVPTPQVLPFIYEKMSASRSLTRKSPLPKKPTGVAARPFHYDRDGQLLCDAVPVAKLAARYGTPLYCYSASQVRERLALFRKHFSRQDHLICYAVKANANLSLLRMIAREGAG